MKTDRAGRKPIVPMRDAIRMRVLSGAKVASSVTSARIARSHRRLSRPAPAEISAAKVRRRRCSVEIVKARRQGHAATNKVRALVSRAGDREEACLPRKCAARRIASQVVPLIRNSDGVHLECAASSAR